METNNSKNGNKENIKIPGQSHFGIIWQILKVEVGNSIIQNKKNLVVVIIVLLLLIGNIFFGIKYFLQIKETQKIQKELSTRRTNDKIVNFLNLFIEKVLKTDKEVSFDDRLKLENTIRDINDSEILSKWEKFTNGTNEAEIQQGVKDLLEILAQKITI